MRSFMHRIVWAVVFSFAAMQSFSYGQEIKDDGIYRGRIDRPNQIESWAVELPNKVETLHIQIECQTTELFVCLRKGDQRIELTPDGKGRGGRAPRNGDRGVYGFNINAYPEPNKHPALDKGMYTIMVQSLKANGTGDYTIRIPELKSNKSDKSLMPETQKEKLIRLEKELGELRKKESNLLEQLRKLKMEPKDNR